MATAEIRARASLDATSFNAGISSMRKSALDLRGVIAGSFSVGAIAAFAKSSLNYAGQFQDMADQFGISASSASALSIALQRVGGSSEKASGILRQLSEKQQESGMTMDQYVQSVMNAYKETQDYSAVVDAVGTKYAPVFIAAMREMEFSLESYKKTAMGVVSDTDAAFADAFGERLDAHVNTARASLAKFATWAADWVSAFAADWGAMFGGERVGQGGARYFREKELEQTLREGEIVARNLENANRRRDGLEQTGMSDPLSGLRTIIASLSGAQANMTSTLGNLFGIAALKPSDALAKAQENAQAGMFDDLRRIGGGLGAGANDPARLQKETRDEVRKMRTATEEVARNTRRNDGGIF